MTFPIEPIDGAETIFRRVPDNRGKNGRPTPGAFSRKGASMSVDWAKHSTPDDTRSRQVKDPTRYGVVSLRCVAVRAETLEVTHAPRDWNRAHTGVTGDLEDPEIRKKLARMAAVEIPIPGEKKP